MESGGRASKFGNAFERLFVVKQALTVIVGENTGLIWEDLGPDERGVDMWLFDSQNTRHAYQAKRNNGSKEYWSIADLHREGVLRHAKEQLERDARSTYTFVSSCNVRHLPDLADFSRRCDNNYNKFYEHLVCSNEHRKIELHKFNSVWGLDPESVRDQGLILSLLQRIFFQVIDREEAQIKDVRWSAGIVLAAEPSEAISAITGILEDSVGISLYSDVLRVQLSGRGISFCDLAHDPTLPEAVERMQRRFDIAISQHLINNSFLGRPELTQITELLQSDERPNLLLIHGSAGSGKSVLAQQAYISLRDHGMPCIPIQLHIRPPSHSPRQYGIQQLELPASPALSLRGMAGDRHAVLILDQLDALRMTSSHSYQAWESCREVIDEALRDPRMTVVLVCRTFDLENDPMISRWRGSQDADTRFRVDTIEAAQLPEDVVSEFVNKNGLKYAELPNRLQVLLRQPATLAIWWSLVQSGGSVEGVLNTTELMRRYIQQQLSKAAVAGVISITNLDDALRLLAARMDRNGALVIHDSTMSISSHLLDALCTVGLTQRDGPLISFSHQGIFDHLVARKALADATQDDTDIVGWITLNQSLYRRDQLRQLLTMLRDADHYKYMSTVHKILQSPQESSQGKAVRFHLQHLVLGLLSQSNPPHEHEVALVSTLVEDPFWREHVFDTVLYGKPVWFDVLLDAGHIYQWIKSWKSDTEIACLFGFLRSITQDRPEEFDALFNRIRELSGQFEDYLGLLAQHDMSHDAPGFFEYRLRQIESHGVVVDGAYLELVAKNKPERVPPLLNAMLVAWELRVREHMSTFENDSSITLVDHHEHYRAINTAIEERAAECWPILVPLLQRAARCKRLVQRAKKREHETRIRLWRLERLLDDSIEIIESYSISAATGLAANHPEALVGELGAATYAHSLASDRVLCKGLLQCHDVYADASVSWLIEDISRFGLGDDKEEILYAPAVALIERFAPICSPPIFESLESAIMSYHDAWELDTVRYQLEQIREGRLVGNRWGLAQNHLLNALPEDRISERARDLRRLWRTKHGNPLDDFPSMGSGRMYRVQSPIPSDRVNRITDKHWLKIISTDWSSVDRKSIRWFHHPAEEPSVSFFAGDLGRAVKNEPVRFAKFALSIPRNSHRDYWYSLLRALQDANRADSNPDSRPISYQMFESIFEHIGETHDRELDLLICWIIDDFTDAHWTLATVARVLQYASNNDPEPDQYAAYSKADSGEEVPDLSNTSLNCVRGAAAAALRTILWSSSDYLSMIVPSVRALLKDPHSSVVMEAFGACLPIWNLDKRLSLELLLEGCDTALDDRVLASHSLHQYLWHARHTFLAELKPIIERMVNSGLEDIQERGAALVAACHFQIEPLEKLYRFCRTGCVSHRKGCADSLQQLFAFPEHSKAVFDDLVSAFSDEDSDVRYEAIHVFNRDGVFGLEDTPRLASAYAASEALEDNPYQFFSRILEEPIDLKPYSESLLLASDRIANSMADATRSISSRLSMVGDKLTAALFRLYEHSYNTDDQISKECLDSWDDLLRNRVGLFGSQSKYLDA